MKSILQMKLSFSYQNTKRIKVEQVKQSVKLINL